MKEYWTDLTSGQKTKLVLKIILGLFALIFAVRNWQSTEVVLIFFKVNMPLTVLILASLAIGFALASLFDYRKLKAKDKAISELKEQMKTLLNPTIEDK
jgi:uncharacterized integral membrane protein